tara:strand:+ start:1317 stop:3086 length:1770 start_codon:yes stop_codon:yes gene_type:complete
MALPSSGNPISFGDINDELGENTTDTLDMLTAAQKFTGILDDNVVSMDEFHGLTFAGGSGAYGTRNSHAFRFINASPDRGFADGELVSAAENSTTDLGGASLTGQSDFVDDFVDDSLTNGDTVFANSTGTTLTNLRPGGDFASGTHFLLDTTANEIAQIDSNADISNVTSRTPVAPTISLSSKNTNSITVAVVGNTIVTRQFKMKRDGSQVAAISPSANGSIGNTNTTTSYTFTGLSSNTSYALLANAHNTFANTDSNTINVTTDAVGPVINSFTATRSETVAGRIDLAWNISAGDGSVTSFLITRNQNSEADASDTQVSTTNDASEVVTGLGQGNTFHFFLRIVTSIGTATANANATTRPAPTIDTFTVAGGSSGGEIDITYATSNADTVTLKEDNTNNGSFETTILDGSSTVDGSVTRTGLTTTNSHNYQLTATGAGSVVATDDAFPTAPTSWTNSVSTVALQNNTGKQNQQDTMTSTINQIAVVNRSGNSSVVVSQTGIDGESLQVRVANNSGMSGATSFANSQTGISYTPIYYQIKWTEDDPLSPGAQIFTEDNPLNQTLSNQITWTNNSVTEQQNVSQDFFNEL